jgi:hypothetical protein
LGIGNAAPPRPPYIKLAMKGAKINIITIIVIKKNK